MRRRGRPKLNAPQVSGSGIANPAIADQYLYDFDIKGDDDGASQDFLRFIISSGEVPREELAPLRKASLMSGVERWDMTIASAQCMRDKIIRARPAAESHVHGLFLMCLRAVLHCKVREVLQNLGITGDAEKKIRAKRKRMATHVSHFWEVDEDNRKNKETRNRASSRAPLGEPADVKDGVHPPLPGSPVSNDPESHGPRKRRRKEQLAAQSHDEQVVEKGQHGSIQWDDDDAEPAEEGATRKRKEGIKKKNRKRSKKKRLGMHAAEEYQDGSEGEDGSLCGLDTSPLASQEPVKDIGVTEKSKRKKKKVNDPNGDQHSSENKEPKATAARTRTTKSPYFTPTKSSKLASTDQQSPSTSTKKRRVPGGIVSRLPIPPLSAPCFGLVQEELAQNPFQLLIAVTFLIKTKGTAAIPVFRQLMRRFPTPEALAVADGPTKIIPMIYHLGLSANRCASIQRYAQTWIERPPSKVRYGVKNYPELGDGKSVKSGEQFGPEDSDDQCDEAEEQRRLQVKGYAWEIGHLTQGRYAIDSWRIFCRDALLGRAEDWLGNGAKEEGFQPEWMRVLPQDKELRACLRWMWMKEGWWWDPLTGEREVLPEEMRQAVGEGRVGYDDSGKLVILNQSQQV